MQEKNFQKVNNTEQISEALTKTIQKLDKKFQKKMPTDKSGTTINILLHFLDNIFVANVGDSKAVMISSDFSSVIDLNKEQNISEKEEQNRLKALALKTGPQFVENVSDLNFKSKHIQFWFDKDEHGDVKKLSAFLPEKIQNIYGVGPSRSISVSSSIGDHIFGPILEPNIEIRHIETNQKILVVLASDGLWGVTSNDEVLGIIRKAMQTHNPQLQPLASLSSKTLKDLLKNLQLDLPHAAWSKYEMREDSNIMRDDITVIVASM